MGDNTSRFGEPPKWLAVAGKTAWALLAEELQDSERVDRLALILACAAYAAAERALQDMSERGPLVEGDRGLVKNPANQVAREQSAAFRAWVGEFGLSPAARKKLGIEPSKRGADAGEDLID